MTLLEYNITLEYVSGKANLVADTLTRINICEGTFEPDNKEVLKVYCSLRNKYEIKKILIEILRVQQEDVVCQGICDRIRNNDPKFFKITLYIKMYYSSKQRLNSENGQSLSLRKWQWN